MKLLFKEPTYFEGQLFYLGDSIEKPQGFKVPKEYGNAIVIEGDDPPKKRQSTKDEPPGLTEE